MATIIQRGAAWRAAVRTRGVALWRTFDTEAEAREWAAAEEDRIRQGKQPRALMRPAADSTVADLFARYAAEVSPEKGGARWEKIRLAYLAPSFQMRATKLDGAAVAEWRDKRLQQVSAATVNRELNLISAVITRAIREWRLPLAANPVHQIQRPKQPPHRTRRVSDAERAAILAALGWQGDAEPGGTREWIAWAWCLALETMMRQGEILALTWQHVHLDRKFAHLPKTKNGHARNVPLSSRARALFELLTPKHPQARVVPVEAGTFGAYFREAVRAAGVEDLHFHDSRREALTKLAPKFRDAMELGAASGHRDLRSLRVYYEPDPTELADKLG